MKKDCADLVDSPEAIAPKSDKTYFESSRERIEFLRWYAEEEDEVLLKLLGRVFGRNKYKPVDERKKRFWEEHFNSGRSLFAHRIPEKAVRRYKKERDS